MLRTALAILAGIGLVLGLEGGAASAQGLRLDDLPETTANTRFFEDRFAVRHPSLTLNGFRCGGLEPGGCAYGLGLAEVLHAVYADVPDPAVKTLFEAVLRRAEEALTLNPTTRAAIIDNTRRLQARAFVALTTYLLEQNGNDLDALNARTAPDLPSHAVALRRFKEDLLQESAFAVDRSINGDAVKWPAVVTNVARTVDLYLALENAYRHYGDPDYDDENAARLLTCAGKGQWLYHAANTLHTLDDLAHEEIILRIRIDEVQPGNWPMKAQVSIGYGALVQQRHDGRCFDLPEHDFAGWFNRALYSAGAPTDQNRSKHWHYQTGSGLRFFAEGPYYFHLSLSEIVPFWHAVRLNDLLGAHPDFTLDDPFHAPWFVRPLNWLADLATPDGRVPALDDGNKAPLHHAGLMRWTAAYGDEALGRKMAWIGDRHGWGASEDLLLLEMAIPRRAAGAGTPPAATMGNTAAGQHDDHQLVIRRPAAAPGGEAATHYVLLNGENDDAIRRGEGHEQADQMQLLYYVDDVSYLLDSGYDDAAGLDNSTWNHYADHNVMTMGLDRGNREGGVKQPRVRLDKMRIVSNHQNVEALYRATAGRLDVLSAHIVLDPDDELGSGLTGDYRRAVLFVHDPQQPYLIDVNAVTGPPDSLFAFAMRYHGNADALSRTPDSDGYALWHALWAATEEPQRTNRRLFLQPFSVEYPLKTRLTADRAREPFNSERDILRLDVESGPPGAATARDHTTVAFIRALLDPDEAPDAARPAQERTHHRAGVPEDSALTWRYYTWWRTDTTLDVLAVRSAAVYRRPALRAVETLAVETPSHVLTLDLPADADYGFARLRYDPLADAWDLDPDYHLSLRLRAAQPVARETGAVPASFRLAPNTPNPFAETTEIHYSLPRAVRVRLAVYDVNGREVARLVDARQGAGRYHLAWKAEGLASGVYLCRLTAGAFSATQRMVLQK